MTPSNFNHRGDLVNEINRLGTLYDIREEMIDNNQVFMLCCSNLHEKCGASIIGLFSQKDKQFHIRRVDSIHTCSKNTKRETALFSEMQKYSTIKRTGELVEKISSKFKVSYYDIFKAQHKGNLTLEFFDKENLRNTGNMFLNELGYSAERELMNFQKTEDLKLECQLSLKQEITERNSQLKVQCNRNNFYVKNTQMNQIFRKITELKVYPRPSGTLILGLLFDSSEEHLIETFMVSDDSKIKALEAFIEYEIAHHFSFNNSNEYTVTNNNGVVVNSDSNPNETDSNLNNNTNSIFYIIDFDYEIIQFLISKNISFFIKSRAVSLYLQDTKEDENYAFDYFHILNYGDVALLDLDKSYYLKKFCPINLYNLNNSHYPDFDFITSNILSLSLIDCVISLIWLISDEIRTKKIIGNDELENKFPEFISSYFEDFQEQLNNNTDNINTNNYNVNLEECFCDCGKFQENLFPCIHAYKKIKELNKDPFLYVSSLYSKDNFLKLQDIVPVVNVKIHPNKVKTGTKKKRSDQNDSDDLN